MIPNVLNKCAQKRSWKLLWISQNTDRRKITNKSLNYLSQGCTVDPTNIAALGTSEKAFWKTAVKGVIYITKKKHIRDFKISGGMGQSTEGQYWGTTYNAGYAVVLQDVGLVLPTADCLLYRVIHLITALPPLCRGRVIIIFELMQDQTCGSIIVPDHN